MVTMNTLSIPTTFSAAKVRFGHAEEAIVDTGKGILKTFNTPQDNAGLMVVWLAGIADTVRLGKGNEHGPEAIHPKVSGRVAEVMPKMETLGRLFGMLAGRKRAEGDIFDQKLHALRTNVAEHLRQNNPFSEIAINPA